MTRRATAFGWLTHRFVALQHNAAPRLGAMGLALVLAACGETGQEGTETGGAEARLPAITAEIEARAPEGRLSRDVQPTAYDLSMVIDPKRDSFSGAANMTLTLARPARGFWLHGQDLEVEKVEVTAEGRTTRGAYKQVLDTGVSYIAFGRQVPAGEIAVDITYEAPFNRNLAGLFKAEEQGEAYALAKSESIQARRFLPGFDEPGFKVPYDIAIAVPRGSKVITNTPEASRAPIDEDYELVTFERTRPMPTYLLSLSVGPFDEIRRAPLPPNSVRDVPIPFRGFTRKGRADDLDIILDITSDFLTILEEDLQLPYPYKKLDIVAAPQWPSGATELSAAITYREQLILLGDDPAPGALRRMLGLHAHELAHMWFGNLVTPPWWNDLWLKEAFSTWATPIVLTQWDPDGGHDIDATERALSAMSLDSLESTRSVREPIASNKFIRNAYDAITYSKGMAVIRMVDHYFGAETFRPALGEYIAKFADGAADANAFYDAIADATGEPALREVFERFTEQPGVPFIEVTPRCRMPTTEATAVPKVGVELKQSRYRPLGSRVEPGQSWTVPMCLSYPGPLGEAKRICTLQREDSRLTIPAQTECPDWVLPNAGGTGYYRWSLPEAGWDALIEAFDGFEASEALTIVDSAIAGFEADKAGAATLRAVLTRAAASPVRQVATSPLGTLKRYIDDIADEDTAAALQAFASDLYKPRLLSAEDDGEATAIQTQLREQMTGLFSQLKGNDEAKGILSGVAESVDAIPASALTDADKALLDARLRGFLALTAEDPDIRADLARAAGRYVGLEGEADESALSSDLFEAAFIVGVQDLGQPFMDRLIVLRGLKDDPQFDRASGEALGRVRNGALAERVREYALSDAVGPREAYAMITGLVDEPALREENWAWVKSSFAEIAAKIPAQWRRRLPGLGGAFCDRVRVDELKALFAEKGDLAPGHERALRQTSERIELCHALREQRADDLAEAFGGE